MLAAVERKTRENLAATLSDGTLAFQRQRLSELPLPAVVVEGRYSALYNLEHVSGSWLADQLAPLEVRHAEVHLVFAVPNRLIAELDVTRSPEAAVRHALVGLARVAVRQNGDGDRELAPLGGTT